MKKLLLLSALFVSFSSYSQTNIETDALKACELMSKFKSIGELYGYGPEGSDIIFKNEPTFVTHTTSQDENGNLIEETTSKTETRNGDVSVVEMYKTGETTIITETRTFNGVTVIYQMKEHINDDGALVVEYTDEFYNSYPFIKLYHNLENELIDLLLKYVENKTFRLYIISNCKFLANVIQDLSKPDTTKLKIIDGYLEDEYLEWRGERGKEIVYYKGVPCTGEIFYNRLSPSYPGYGTSTSTSYKDGKQDGLFEQYYENGKLEVREYFKNGIQYGLEFYNENGELIQKAKFANGEIKEIKNYKDGVLIEN